jgi:Ca2+/Na+ antiporter
VLLILVVFCVVFFGGVRVGPSYLFSVLCFLVGSVLLLLFSFLCCVFWWGPCCSILLVFCVVFFGKNTTQKTNKMEQHGPHQKTTTQKTNKMSNTDPTKKREY